MLKWINSGKELIEYQIMEFTEHLGQYGLQTKLVLINHDLHTYLYIFPC